MRCTYFEDNEHVLSIRLGFGCIKRKLLTNGRVVNPLTGIVCINSPCIKYAILFTFLVSVLNLILHFSIVEPILFYCSLADKFFILCLTVGLNC